MMNDIIIKAEKLTKIYKLSAEKITAVKEVDLEVKKGDFLAIMGPSGSGKTTFLDALGCLDSLTSGKLEIAGKDVSNLRESKLVNIRREHIGFVFQDFLLIPSLTAAENVELSVSFTGKKIHRNRTIDLLKKVGLGHRIDHLPKQLSGGEKQRVAIARALITGPDVLLADEPTGDLDSKTSQEIIDIFTELNRSDGLTIIMATHDQHIGSQAKKVIHFRDGMIEKIEGLT